MELKARLHGERYPVDEDFLAALSTMPQASGIALGFDRLVMLLTGAARIDEVLWAPPASASFSCRKAALWSRGDPERHRPGASDSLKRRHSRTHEWGNHASTGSRMDGRPHRLRQLFRSPADDRGRVGSLGAVDSGSGSGEHAQCPAASHDQGRSRAVHKAIRPEISPAQRHFRETERQTYRDHQNGYRLCIESMPDQPADRRAGISQSRRNFRTHGAVPGLGFRDLGTEDDEGHGVGAQQSRHSLHAQHRLEARQDGQATRQVACRRYDARSVLLQFIARGLARLEAGESSKGNEGVVREGCVDWPRWRSSLTSISRPPAAAFYPCPCPSRSDRD